MDKKLEKSGHQKILRRLARKLQERGFERKRNTFFVRSKDEIIQFIHLHKFTFAPEFRVHLGIKKADDESDIFHLDGIDSFAYQCKNSPSGKKYNFGYHEAEETIERCAENLFQFCCETGEKWFADNS